MPKFEKTQVAELLGPRSVAFVSDAQIWQEVLTPMVRALLGPIKSVRAPELRETVEGLFPGDEVHNLNNHLLYGGKQGFVRFPYIYNFYRTAYGAFIVKRDPVKVEARGWVGNIEKGNAELIFKAALRDRCFDGTLRASDCSLVSFPIYHDSDMNGRITEDASSVELSVYGFLPGSSILDATGDAEFQSFVENPFEFLDRPEVFRRHFDRAWTSNRGPGQFAAPIPDVSRFIAGSLEKIAARRGYDLVENAPSHYHVVMWTLASGYQISCGDDAQTMADFAAGIKRIKESGVKLSRAQESWVCVAQSLPREFIPEGLDLNGPVWPQDNIGPRNLWTYKALTDKGRAAVTGPACPRKPDDSGKDSQ